MGLACLPRLLTLLRLLAFAGSVVAGASAAQAERRVALVIGNSSYQFVAALPNPANDAAAIAGLFQRAGFDVVEAKNNLSGTDMRRALRDFSDQVKDADIAVVYYAGHGMEVDGTNYLVPVDAKLERDIDVEDEALSIDRIMRVVEPARRLRLIILDACRDNPFTRSMTRTVRNRSIGRGLGKVEPTVSDTLIAFAAKAGSFANDGDGANSPFTTALLNRIATPGLDLRIAFGMVRDDVLKMTGNKQEPFVYGSLGGSLVSLAASPPAPAAAAAPLPGAAPMPTPVTVQSPVATAPSTPKPAVQTASVAPSSANRNVGGLDDYLGRSVKIEFFEIEEEIRPQVASHTSRRLWTIAFRARDDIQFQVTVVLPNQTQNLSPIFSNILGVGSRGVRWDYKDGQVIGLLQRPGFRVKPTITINGSTCSAALAFEKAPGKQDFEMPRMGTNETMYLRSVTAEKVSCRVIDGDAIAALPNAAR